MSHNITVQGGKSVRLKTAGKFCDRDIVVTAEGGSGGDGYVVCETTAPHKTNTVADLEQLRLSYPNATSLADDAAFSDCTSLISVNLPLVTSIGQSAFIGCSSLASINLPNATDIGGDAFFKCTSLTSIDLPNATNIGVNAFYNCLSLASINLPNATIIDALAFYGCSSLASIDLPNVTIINNGAFIGCSSLASINLPNATNLEDKIFHSCTSLTSISLPKATSIGYITFYECLALPSIELPSARSILDSAFYGCTSLDTLILSNTETLCNLNLSAIMGTKIATENGEPTGEGFIYVPEALYEQYMANLTEQAYMLLVYSGYSEAEAEYMAPYIISSVLRTIEGEAQATTFGLRNPLANFHGFTQEAIELFKANYKGAITE